MNLGFPGGSDGKVSACNAEDPGSVPELGKSPREGNSYPLQYFCLEKSMERGAWGVTVHGVTKSWTQQSTAWNICINNYVWIDIYPIESVSLENSD